MSTYNVLASRQTHVERELKVLDKRAQRKGLLPITWQWGKLYSYLVPLTGKETAKVPLTITSEPSQYQGWSFVASLAHVDGETVIASTGTHELPKKYRNSGATCEHCSMNRRRKNTYVLHHAEKGFFQVGSSCLSDFLGTDRAEKLAYLATIEAEIRDACEDDSKGRREEGWKLREFLAVTSDSIRTHGWVSRTTAREYGSRATADTVINTLRETYAPATAQGTEEAGLAADWAESLSDAIVDAAKGDYLHNVRAVARIGYINGKSAGIAASIVTAYQRHVAEERKKAETAALPASNYVGQVGKRETFRAKLDMVSGYDTDYGYTTVLKFRTATGAVILWKASSGTGVSRSDAGKTYLVTGSVKEQSEYKGVKQTVLTRCKLAELNEPVERAQESIGFAANGCSGAI